MAGHGNVTPSLCTYHLHRECWARRMHAAGSVHETGSPRLGTDASIECQFLQAFLGAAQPEHRDSASGDSRVPLLQLFGKARSEDY